ncbi:MAG: hypothetical protein ABF946_02935 [Acetobacter papayae]
MAQPRPVRTLSHTAHPLLLALLMLGGCMNTPHTPPHPAAPARLDIPAPTTVGLVPASAQLWATDMAQALQGQSVAASARPATAGAWWLRLPTRQAGGQVIPVYTIMTPASTPRAAQDGAGIAQTLWQPDGGGTVSPAILSGMAQDAAPRIASLLTGIQAAAMEQDPNSLKHRPARVFFSGVTGAPGKGNTALASAFRATFPDTHDTLTHHRAQADYTLNCTVRVSDAPPDSDGQARQHLDIIWTLHDAAGQEAGGITQLHDIHAHALDGDWGETARNTAHEAAAAARQIIDRYSGRTNTPLPTPAP